MKKSVLSVFILALVLSACAPTQSQNAYEAREVGKQSNIEFGRILSIRKVKIQGNTTGAGAASGIAAGGIAGSNVGNGNGSVAGLIAGAIVGGIAGSAAEKAAMKKEGVEYLIKKDNGKTVSITQNIAEDDKPLAVGQRIMIQTSGEYQRAASDRKLGEQYQRVLPVEK